MIYFIDSRTIVVFTTMDVGGPFLVLIKSGGASTV